ncbi:MAG TPA: MFS transporter [Clostridiales bacterium]|nr:MFS transporter [Clostridiales bacterium]
MEEKKQKKSLFETPLLSTKVKSANAKIFPEGGLGYFIGPTLALLANSILSGYLNMYMTNVLNINSWAKTFFTLLPVISVIFVVAGNILVGRLMDRCKTKAGKARPLLLVSIPLSILALLILFTFAPGVGDISTNKSTQTVTLVMLALGYNLWFAVAYPFYYTSHAALVNLSTRNSKDRSLLATISNATALAAMGLCSMVLPFFLRFLFITDDNGVTNAVASQNAWRVFVIALIVITAIGVLIEYFFTRERITEESFANKLLDNRKKAEPISKQAKACFKDKFWWIIIIFFFLYQLGGMLKNVSQLYYCQAMFEGELPNGTMGHSTDIGGGFHGTLSIIGAIPTALGMVIAWPLATKIGKGKAILYGAVLSVIGGAIGFIAPTNFYVVTTSFVIKALGSTPAMYLSLALLADILDHQEAVHGFRTDGFTMTIYGAIMAGMTGIATGILNGMLGLTGYNAEQNIIATPAIQEAMKWIFIGGETICYAVIVIIFIFMGVEKFTAIDKRAIEMNHKAEAAAEGVEYVVPATKLEAEEKEAEAAAEEARKAELKKKCEKKGLNFEEQEAAYQKMLSEKQAAQEAKKQAAEAKKAAALKAKAEKEAAFTEEQKAEIAKKAELKAKKKAEKEAAALEEFNKLRQKNNQPVLEQE